MQFPCNAVNDIYMGLIRRSTMSMCIISVNRKQNRQRAYMNAPYCWRHGSPTPSDLVLRQEIGATPTAQLTH